VRLFVRIFSMFIEVALVRLSVLNFLASIVSHFGVEILYGVSRVPKRIFLFRFMAVLRTSISVFYKNSINVKLIRSVDFFHSIFMLADGS